MQNDGLLDRVQDLVPFHGFTDVLDVVQPTEIPAGHSRIGVVEAGCENQSVPGDLALTCDARHLAGRVDARDLRVVVHVDPGIDVGLLGSQEQALEVVDLLAMHVGDSARTVGNVVEAGVDHHLRVGRGRFDAARRAHAGRAAADDYDS